MKITNSLIICLVAIGTLSAQASLIFSDDFSGDLSSWDITKDASSTVEITNDEELWLKEANGGAAQVLSPVIPALHTLSFDYRIPEDGGNVGFATQLRFQNTNDNNNGYELRFTNTGTFRNADNEGWDETFPFAKEVDYRVEFANTETETTMRIWRKSDNELLRTWERDRADSLDEGRFSIRVNSSSGTTNNQEIFIDNFEVIPEPSALGFLLFGGVGLLLARRRRRLLRR